MAQTLLIEAGVAVSRVEQSIGRVRFATLPAGRYVVANYIGHYDGLYDATAMLIGWAKERTIAWDVRHADDGDHFACRLEVYLTDPSQQPDSTKWVTQLAFKTAD